MIDWARVNEFRDEVGAEDFDEVVELFLEEVVDAMTKVASGPDVAALENELHAIKGAAMNLGFQTLAEHCKTGEKIAASGEVPAEIIAALPQIYQDSHAAFSAGRADLGNAA